MVAQRHLRYVGKDCLVAFEANLYSVLARRVRPCQLVEIRATKSQVALHSTTPDARATPFWPPTPGPLAEAPGSWMRSTGAASPPEPAAASQRPATCPHPAGLTTPARRWDRSWPC
ncbi:Mu transposase domain-containing protein [Streptomyces sp. NPDC002514]